MTTRRRLLGFWAVVLLAVGSISPSVAGQSPPAPRFAIVVGKDNPVDEMSFADLKRLYKGEFVNDRAGNKLIPLALPARSPDRVAFDELVLAMAPSEVANYWVDRKIRGLSGAPKSVESPDLLMRILARLPSSVGYVPEKQAQGSDVKIVKIDGKLPGEPGYRVQ